MLSLFVYCFQIVHKEGIIYLNILGSPSEGGGSGKDFMVFAITEQPVGIMFPDGRSFGGKYLFSK